VGVAQAPQVAALALGLGDALFAANAAARLVALTTRRVYLLRALAGSGRPRMRAISCITRHPDKAARTAQSGVFSLRCRRRLSEQLSPAQIREIVRTYAPMMQRFGYLQPDCGGSVSLVRLAREI
jgi:hypothetical protein